MKENLNNKNGITLIALIITIIVLLILAMVSIKLVWNEGMIQHANNAVNDYSKAQINELEQINATEQKMNEYANNNKTNWWELTEEEKEELKNYTTIDPNYGENYFIAVHGESNQQNDEKYAALFNNCLGIEKAKIYIIIKDQTAYYMALNDEGVQALNKDEEYSFNNWGNDYKNKGYTYQKLKWYASEDESHFVNGKEYNGGPLLSEDDFEENEIYCKTYFDRIIEYAF